MVATVKTKAGGAKIMKWWKVIVEVPVGNCVKEFTLEVELKPDFPLSLPKIKLSQADYQATKFLPHVDSGGSICLFDQANLKLDTNQPGRIVKDCLNQAVKIIADGLNKNRLLEFQNEIVAYWEDSYHSNDVVVAGYLGDGVEGLVPGKVVAHYLVKPYANVNLYLGSTSAESLKVIEFFKMRGHTVQELEAFYLGQINYIEPPFYMDNKTLLKFIEQNFNLLWKQVKSYLNRGAEHKLLVFSVFAEGKSIFFSFYLDSFQININGWRPKSLNTTYGMSNVKPTQPVTRLKFVEFNPQRFRMRTDGRASETPPLKFMLAGLGSIGSNLLFYLSKMNVSGYILVDPEIFVIENVNRHLLSFDDVGMNKVDAIAKYLISTNPFLNIKKYAASVVDAIHRHLSEINEMDFIFCAIGNDTIESYLLQYLANGQIKKPVLLFWVEPYLFGAHVLYLHPSMPFEPEILETGGFYNLNIIAKETYQDPLQQLSLREAGCQGSYAPYGKEAIAEFFAALVPDLFKLLKHPPSESRVFTYVGDLFLADKLEIKLSDFGKGLKPHQLIVQILNATSNR